MTMNVYVWKCKKKKGFVYQFHAKKITKLTQTNTFYSVQTTAVHHHMAVNYACKLLYKSNSHVWNWEKQNIKGLPHSWCCSRFLHEKCLLAEETGKYKEHDLPNLTKKIKKKFSYCLHKNHTYKPWNIKPHSNWWYTFTRHVQLNATL